MRLWHRAASDAAASSCVLVVFFNGLWWYGRRAGLVDPALTAADLRRISVRWGSGPPLYLACTLLVFVQFWAGVAGFAVALYLVPPPPAAAPGEAGPG